MIRKSSFLIMLLLTHWVHAQVPNALDLSFGDSGKIEIHIDEYDYLSKIQVVDSSIYFAGYTGHYDSSLNFDAVVGRLDYFGNLDTSFNDSGYIRFDFPDDNHSTITDISVGDSGIYFIGNSLDYGTVDTLHLFIGKLDFSGKIDSTFALNGFFSPNLGRYNIGNAIDVIKNEQLLFCGASENYSTLSDHPLMGRLHANGDLDTTFGNTGLRIWDSNGELVDSVCNTLQEKHGAGGYLTNFTIVDSNYFFTGNYRPGSNNMCLMIMVKENGDINTNYGGLGYRVFELSPNNENNIITSFYKNDTLFSLINVIGNGYGNVTLFMQDSMGTQLNSSTYNIPNWVLETKDMALTTNGDIAICGYSIQENSSSSVSSEGFFITAMEGNGNYISTYNNDGYFIETFNKDETGAEDLFYSNGSLYTSGSISKMLPGNVFDFGLVKMNYDPSLGNNESQTKDLKIYPNPAQTLLTIESDFIPDNLFVVSLEGRILFSESPLTNVSKIELTTLANGVYLVRIQKGQSSYTKKLIIKK